MSVYPQVLRNRPRMVLGFVVGVAIGALLASVQMRPIIRVLVSWDVAVWTYLALMWIEMARADHERVRDIAQREDENAVVVLAIVCLSTVASIVAIVLELASSKGSTGVSHYVVTGVTLIGAWFLVPTIFTLHYARLHFGTDQQQAALKFPDHKLEPNYWDFLYFSFTIAVASQTSDVVLCSREVRRAALAQSVLSFYFNVAVLGLCVNMAAGLLGS
ncbi:DUF1345 domain-containing protein [Paraburkholderia phymatum]|uniref:Transmembrane protein n=1 Tax=Paraburkholderia phymatum (strain DSM 17167 / CIP 108236 / LMG 21445 / STM815) TaxID=391038 RepID=B2JQG8_PARP8|nr:DUF1345 domain-containing protein [Paraburkholderia phymatum]ACC73509.1 protein of unknown function DUF1345 [Paraburkholderia phymatum STM815]